jgi:polysaccharide biosynthesis protein PelF
MLGSSVLRQIFQSFLQAGYECSTHKLRNGRRLDLVSATQHDRFVREDYDRALSEGMQTVREGLRWPLIEQTPGKLSFTSLYPFLTAARGHTAFRVAGSPRCLQAGVRDFVR